MNQLTFPVTASNRSQFAIRLLLPALTAIVVLFLWSSVTMAQPPMPPARVRPDFTPPKTTPPDAETRATIDQQIDTLREAVDRLKEMGVPETTVIDVEVYLRAAQSIVKFDEWYTAMSGKWALATLEQGIARAEQAANGTTPWINTKGQWTVHAYRSRIDGSIQPYAVLKPHDFDAQKKWRLDVVLHGRDTSLSEAKFIATHQGPAPQDLAVVQLEVFGRGNNAYRWAGEIDVFEAVDWFCFGPPNREGRRPSPIDPNRVVLRGFSMGGAGTWHIGLHHPSQYCVIGPGAGFSTTRGYVANLPEQLPDHVEKCLHIYDAVDYAENAFNVPIVAYSGEKDPQRQAATNIETALTDFSEPLRFTHMVAPGLEHTMPKEWQDKAEREYRKFADNGRSRSQRVRFVTYTPRYGTCDWIHIDALDATFRRALVDGRREGNTFDVRTTNVRRMSLWLEGHTDAMHVTLDGQVVDTNSIRPDFAVFVQFERTDGKWSLIEDQRVLKRRLREKPEKRAGLQGPIDDAFMSQFVVIGPNESGISSNLDQLTTRSLERFEWIWTKYFRGDFPIQDESTINTRTVVSPNLILFGDPKSNPLIAHFLPKLPITWDDNRLIVNGIEYDAKSHIPVLIYPNPIDPNKYLVINSGHTFSEADLRGTNALLYPHLGDWAVLKVSSDSTYSDGYEVVAAGLFNENWQFAE